MNAKQLKNNILFHIQSSNKVRLQAASCYFCVRLDTKTLFYEQSDWTVKQSNKESSKNLYGCF